MKCIVAMGVAMLLALGLCLTVGMSMASATTVAAAENKAGGYIVLTPALVAPNGFTCRDSMVAVTFAEGHNSVMGCWTPEAGRIVIHWNGGVTTTHPQDVFSAVEVGINFDTVVSR